MVRFGYRKITLVALWKVEERGQVRNSETKRLVKLGDCCKKQPENNEGLDEDRGFKGGEKKTPQCYFIPGQLEIIFRHAEQLKTDI